MPEQPEIACPICFMTSPYIEKEPSHGDYSIYNCARCKRYKITGTAEAILSYSKNNHFTLSAWLRECNERDLEMPCVDSYTLNSFNEFPPKKSDRDKIYNLLNWINNQTETAGQKVNVVSYMDYPIIWGKNEGELYFYLEALINKKFIKYEEKGQLGDSFSFNVSVTMDGRDFLTTHQNTTVSRHVDTTWRTVNNYLDSAYECLRSSTDVAKLKNCAHSCRESIVALSNAIYNEDEYDTYEKTSSSYSNALTQLEIVIGKILKGKKFKEQRKVIKDTLTLAHKYAHAGSVNHSQAAMCFSMTTAAIELITNTLSQKSA